MLQLLPEGHPQGGYIRICRKLRLQINETAYNCISIVCCLAVGTLLQSVSQRVRSDCRHGTQQHIEKFCARKRFAGEKNLTQSLTSSRGGDESGHA